MDYFKFPSKIDSHSKNIFMIFSFLVIIIGCYNIAHGVVLEFLYSWGYQIGQQQQAPPIVQKVYADQFLYPAIYLIVAGSFTIIFFVILMLKACGHFNKNSIMSLRITFFMLAATFALQFGVGVFSSLAAISFNSLFSDITQQNIINQAQQLPAGPQKSFILTLPNAINMTTAEAPLSFIIGSFIPLFLMGALIYNLQEGRRQEVKSDTSRTIDNQNPLIQRSSMRKSVV